MRVQREGRVRRERAAPLTPRLPETYVDALALAAAGCNDELIARRLAVPVESIATLLEIARAKVRAIVDDDQRERARATRREVP